MNVLKFFLMVLVMVALAPVALAEPYLAVRSGQPCSSCHINPTGGGMRSLYGTTYGIQSLPADADAWDSKPWDGALNEWLRIGGDLRAQAVAIDTPNQEEQFEFDTRRASLYVAAAIVPERLTFYLDQQMSPTSSNREAYALLQGADHVYHVKAGQFFLPFGLRLEDDSAFIRRFTGISFATPDNGIEVGWTRPEWSVQFALTNGTSGGADNNTDKQLSLRGELVRPSWRIGASLNQNPGLDGADRSMVGLFGGLEWLGVTWLAEVDQISDKETISGDLDRRVGLLEANWLVHSGHNLKLTLEQYDPDIDLDEDEQTRTSIVYEWTPAPLLQLRFGARAAEGIPQNDAQNSDQFFAEWHSWF